MKRVVVLQGGGVSMDRHAKRPSRSFASQSLTVAAAFLLLIGGGTKPVYAGSIVITGVQTNVGASPVGAGSYNQGQTGSHFTTVGGGTASGTIDATGALTSAFDQATITGAQAGTVFARADLSTGALGASILSPLGATQVNDSATASYSDVLHFIIQGAGVSTITDIGVQFTLNGSIGNGPDGGSGFGGTVASSFGMAQNGWTGAGVVTNIVDGKNNAGCVDFTACISGQTFSYPGTTGPSGWVSYSFTSDTTGSIIFNGVFALHGATADVAIGNYVSLSGAGGQISEDYSHTSVVGLSLPNGVTYTSDSGVFDTAASTAPEPATFGLLGAALLGMGMVQRRRAKRQR